MSIEGTRRWIAAHKRKDDAVARWDGALEDSRVCAAVANRVPGNGFDRASAYYDCRTGKTIASLPTHIGLFVHK